MRLKIFLDLNHDLSGANFFIPDKTGGDELGEPDKPIPYGARRLSVEIEISEPYDRDKLMAYVEEVGVGLLHVPRKGVVLR